MLPDFPELKQDLRKKWAKRLQDEVRKQAPLAARIARFRQHEGHRFSYENAEGRIETQEYKEIGAKFEISSRDLNKPKRVQATMEGNLQNAARDIARQTEGLLFTTLDKVTRETGNVVDAGGQPFSSDLFLDSLETLQIEFEADGTPQLPTLVLHPEVFEAAMKTLENAESDAAFQKRRSEILRKKKQEWRDREANRKLVG